MSGFFPCAGAALSIPGKWHKGSSAQTLLKAWQGQRASVVLSDITGHGQPKDGSAKGPSPRAKSQVGEPRLPHPVGKSSGMEQAQSGNWENFHSLRVNLTFCYAGSPNAVLSVILVCYIEIGFSIPELNSFNQIRPELMVC